MQALVLCGGKASRIKLLTTDRPKALLPIFEIPFLELLLAELREIGISDVILLAGHQVEILRAKGFSNSVRIIEDGDRALGTGGCLRPVIEWCDEYFVVVNGDSFIAAVFENESGVRASIKSFSRSGLGCQLSIGLPKLGNISNCQVSDGDWALSEYVKSGVSIRNGKSAYIDLGFTLFKKSYLKNVIEMIPEPSFDVGRIYDIAAKDGFASTYFFQGEYFDIGTLAGYSDFLTYLLKRGNA